jgi:hypothetical protein
MTMTTVPQPDEADEFSVFRTLGEIFGFAYHDKGEGTLRQLLTYAAAHQNADNSVCTITCESIQEAAEELAQAGLSKPAKIVAAHAANFPSELDLNPYSAGSTNAEYWLQSKLRERDRAKHQITPAKRPEGRKVR